MSSLKKVLAIINFIFNEKRNIKLKQFKHKLSSTMLHSRFIKFIRKSNMGSKFTKRCSSTTDLSVDRTNLTEEAIRLLISNTTMTREQIIDFHANFIRDCPSGCMTKKHFIRMFKELHPSDSKKQKVDKFCDYVFRYN